MDAGDSEETNFLPVISTEEMLAAICLDWVYSCSKVWIQGYDKPFYTKDIVDSLFYAIWNFDAILFQRPSEELQTWRRVGKHQQR